MTLPLGMMGMSAVYGVDTTSLPLQQLVRHLVNRREMTALPKTMVRLSVSMMLLERHLRL